MRLKRLAAAATLVATVIGLSACGGGGSAKSDPRTVQSVEGARQTLVEFWKHVDDNDPAAACAMIDPVRVGPSCEDGLRSVRAQYPNDIHGFDDKRIGKAAVATRCAIGFAQVWGDTNGPNGGQVPGSVLGTAILLYKHGEWVINDIGALVSDDPETDPNPALLGEPTDPSTYHCGQ